MKLGERADCLSRGLTDSRPPMVAPCLAAASFASIAAVAASGSAAAASAAAAAAACTAMPVKWNTP